MTSCIGFLISLFGTRICGQTLLFIVIANNIKLRYCTKRHLWFASVRVCVCVCSLAIQPQYPQLCIRQSSSDRPAGVLSSPAAAMSAQQSAAATGETLDDPMQLSAVLNSLPCSLTFTADDHLTVIQTLVSMVCIIIIIIIIIFIVFIIFMFIIIIIIMET